MRATYKELAKAFYDAGRRELVDEICNIVNTQAVDRAGHQRAEGNVLKVSAHNLIMHPLVMIVQVLISCSGKNCHQPS